MNYLEYYEILRKRLFESKLYSESRLAKMKDNEVEKCYFDLMAKLGRLTNPFYDWTEKFYGYVFSFKKSHQHPHKRSKK